MAVIKRKATAKKLPTRTTRGTIGGERAGGPPRRRGPKAPIARRQFPQLRKAPKASKVGPGAKIQSFLKALGALQRMSPSAREIAFDPLNLIPVGLRGGRKSALKATGEIVGLRKRPKRAPKGGR